MSKSGFDLFEGIVYINLEHRKDRKENLLGELSRLGAAHAERIPAIYEPLNGAKGCYLSHIMALELAEKRGWKEVLILEDDCVFGQNVFKIKQLIEKFFQTFKREWDVFLLGGRYLQLGAYSKEFVQVYRSVRAHAYVVNSPYYSILKGCFLKGYEGVRGDVFVNESFDKALDCAWHPLQKKGRWFASLESLAEQKENFSDILHIEVKRKEDVFNRD